MSEFKRLAISVLVSIVSIPRAARLEGGNDWRSCHLKASHARRGWKGAMTCFGAALRDRYDPCHFGGS